MTSDGGSVPLPDEVLPGQCLPCNRHLGRAMTKKPLSDLLPEPAFCNFCGRARDSRAATFITLRWAQILHVLRRWQELTPPKRRR